MHAKILKNFVKLSFLGMLTLGVLVHQLPGRRFFLGHILNSQPIADSLNRPAAIKPLSGPLRLNISRVRPWFLRDRDESHKANDLAFVLPASLIAEPEPRYFPLQSPFLPSSSFPFPSSICGRSPPRSL